MDVDWQSSLSCYPSVRWYVILHVVVVVVVVVVVITAAQNITLSAN